MSGERCPGCGGGRLVHAVECPLRWSHPSTLKAMGLENPRCYVCGQHPEVGNPAPWWKEEDGRLRHLGCRPATEGA